MDNQNKISAKRDPFLMKIVLIGGLIAFIASAILLIYPEMVQQHLNLDKDMITTFGYGCAFIGLSDIAIAFFIFRPKEHK